ncbi:Aerobic glycerol-3-phosphate dehydrogenase [Sphingobacterium spiritivorum]|uniref:Aerobic glycerol-3-phosphate dehydrogenase n=1 Tax=Sphingobacterium spiritivorum TaxID=258 RepID=A0A380CWA1_SPHSI|nr:glycerol-3-phosphate dehydrogenase/oxidase [Sphingobacterium spiritivorum]SUJ29843.1 Aerobic glycerol-3-phosphate dehydrogenase [Sphingobacterium spiritivorum]
MKFDRNEGINSLYQTQQWDIAIIGGGATGLGIAADAASRGYKTILLEKYDFAKATSSRSTKLVHGGVRYLANGDVKLVYSALHERGLIFRNAPHVARIQSFIIPCYSWFSKLKYLIGLKLYDWMAGSLRIGKSVYLNKNEVISKLPTVKASALQGGIQYFDGQFDDARLALNLGQTAAEYGATIINYADVTHIGKNEAGKVNGLTFVDQETGQSHTIQAKSIINATGIFVDDILKLEEPKHKNLVRPSQGTHIVVDKKFLGKSDALMIPETSDGRVLFGVPWHGHVLLGTTDTPLDQHQIEPRPLEEEIKFILDTAYNYMEHAPTRSDILSVFAGLRPLAAPQGDDVNSTKEISRDHKLISNASGLVTITGGKWTTYRKMAEETINLAIKVAALDPKACMTKTLKIHGYAQNEEQGHWKFYGSDAEGIRALAATSPELAAVLHPKFEHIAAEVVWAVRYEMARNIEDVLARRMRILFLDAKTSLEMVPQVAKLMAQTMGKDELWINEQTESYRELVKNYIIN